MRATKCKQNGIEIIQQLRNKDCEWNWGEQKDEEIWKINDIVFQQTVTERQVASCRVFRVSAMMIAHNRSIIRNSL